MTTQTLEDKKHYSAFYFLVECIGKNLRHQLRAFILEPHAALAEGRRSSHVAGDNRARRGQKLACFETDSRRRKFVFDGRIGQANRQDWLALPVAANRACCFQTVKAVQRSTIQAG